LEFEPRRFDLRLTQSLDWDCFVRADAVLKFEADDDDQDQEEEEEFSATAATTATADAHIFSLASI
jgi:hypothetical protein